MTKEDPLDKLLSSLGGDRGNERVTMEKIVSELEEFYDNLALVLKHGTPWQKKTALGFFKNLQEGLKGKLEHFCREEGLDMKDVEKFLTLPEMQSLPETQEMQEKVHMMNQKVMNASCPKKGAVKKPLAVKGQRKKMEKHLRSKL